MNCIITGRYNPYQIGDIYLTTSSIDPNIRFGGTWEKIKDVFLLGSGDTYTAGATGGEATHTLTVSEMPKHTHTYSGFDTRWTHGGSGEGSEYAVTKTSSATGGDAAHNNMPPYLVVNIWKRIA